MLPEGTRVLVGHEGSAVVGGVVLSANATAIVADGSVVIDSIPTDGPAPSTTDRPMATPTVAERPPPALPTPTPLSGQRPVDRPPATATPIPEPSETVARGAEIQLRVQRPSAGRALLEWTVSGETSGIDGWEVLVRRGDDIRTLATLRYPSARELSVAVPDDPPDGFRIVARGSGGTAISRSGLVSLPELDRPR